MLSLEYHQPFVARGENVVDALSRQVKAMIHDRVKDYGNRLLILEIYSGDSCELSLGVSQQVGGNKEGPPHIFLVADVICWPRKRQSELRAVVVRARAYLDALLAE